MNNFEFPVSVYGKLEKYNDVLSKDGAVFL